MRIKTILENLLERRFKRLRSKSIESYKGKTDRFIKYLQSRKIYQFDRVNREVAESFLDSCNFRSNTTYNNYKVVLATVFDLAIEAGHLKKNPFKSIERMSEARRGKMYFQPHQARHLLTVIERESPMLYMACLFQYYCFIRPRELRFMPIHDIVLHDKYIRVHASYSKNKKTQTVIIPDEFLPILTDWVNMPLIVPDTFYAINKKQQTVSENHLSTLHRDILKRLGYTSRYSFYSWKHTGAVNFWKETRDLKALQMQLRHHSLDQVDQYLRELGVMDSATIKQHRLPPSGLYAAA